MKIAKYILLIYISIFFTGCAIFKSYWFHDFATLGNYNFLGKKICVISPGSLESTIEFQRFSNYVYKMFNDVGAIECDRENADILLSLQYTFGEGRLDNKYITNYERGVVGTKTTTNVNSKSKNAVAGGVVSSGPIAVGAAVGRGDKQTKVNSSTTYQYGVIGSNTQAVQETVYDIIITLSASENKLNGKEVWGCTIYDSSVTPQKDMRDGWPFYMYSIQQYLGKETNGNIHSKIYLTDKKYRIWQQAVMQME